MRLSTQMVWSLVVLSVVVLGCNQNRYLTPSPLSVTPQAQESPYVSQIEDLDRRATALDSDNRDLHSQLARSQQRTKLLEEHVQRLNTELQQKATELQEMLTAQHATQENLETLQASTRRRGGAMITANNSQQTALREILVPGVEVRREADVMRLELPADQLFQTGTNQFSPTSQAMLDQVAAAIAQNYSQNIVGVEGHTDTRPLGATSNHQLSADQALAVFRVLTSRNRLPVQQLFTVGYGANHPRASNATPAGRQKNRRIELVIYPDKWKS